MMTYFLPIQGLKTGLDLRGWVWKRVWKFTFLGVKWGKDLENREAQPHQIFPGIPPRDLLTFSLRVPESFRFRYCIRQTQGEFNLLTRQNIDNALALWPKDDYQSLNATQTRKSKKEGMSLKF